MKFDLLTVSTYMWTGFAVCSFEDTNSVWSLFSVDFRKHRIFFNFLFLVKFIVQL